MDKNWSDKNKQMQKLLAREKTFKEGISTLLELREELFSQITQIVMTYPKQVFCQMPYPKASGFHNKTLAYSIWHIFRIEDIVAHEMIAEDRQILFSKKYDKSIGSPIITTGNELAGDEIVEFSKKLNITKLYKYASNAKDSTDRILQKLEYPDLKRRFDEDMYRKLQESGCISSDEKASNLIDYWCSKDVEGLIRMPFSRHWIMHIEAMLRIASRIRQLARKGIDPIAYCGLSCDHCFLGLYCGSCRTDYNVCSNATMSPDGVCPNVKCCKEKGYDGCYECEELESCQKGFYVPSNDGANAAKAHCLYIRKYGKKELLKVQDRLHKKFDFEKTQEILGQDLKEGLKILENN